MSDVIHMATGDYAFRVLPKAMSSLVRLKDLAFVDCGVQGFEGGLEALTELTSLAVQPPLTEHSSCICCKL